MSTLATFIPHSIEVLARAVRHIREKKWGDPNSTERSKTVTIADFLILCIENPKDYQKLWYSKLQLHLIGFIESICSTTH